MRRPLLVMLSLLGCATAGEQPAISRVYVVAPLPSGSPASLRGVSVVDARTAWASGTAGTVLRTTDGGSSWLARNVPDADSLDFRDIEAFDSLTAFVLSAGEDGRIYRTVNGGRTWYLQFQNTVRGAFFDCFDFWDRQHGLAMSDPVEGRFYIMRTTDGNSWQRVDAAGLPAAQAGEAAFAASGTCLVTVGRERAFLATGGGAQARVLVSDDAGRSWQAVATSVAGGAPSAGIFSLAFRDTERGVALGGDYQKPAASGVVARTANGGRSWAAVGNTGYVSGAAFTGAGNALVAVGTPGTRISHDAGVTWAVIDTVEYNAVQFAADGTGYAVGPRGRIAKIERR